MSDGYGNCRVHQFGPNGELKRSWGTPGQGPGEFFLPHGISVHADGRVFVCDRENDRIQIFSPDGEYLSEWTDTRRPTHLVFDGQGRAYVSELWWQPGQTSGRYGPAGDTRSGRASVYDGEGRVLARWVVPIPSPRGASRRLTAWPSTHAAMSTWARSRGRSRAAAGTCPRAATRSRSSR